MMAYEFLNHFGVTLKEFDHDEIEEILDKLYTFKYLKIKDLKLLRSYGNALNEAVKLIDWLIEDGDFKVTDDNEEYLKQLRKETDKINWILEHHIYRNTGIELLDMHSIVSHLFWTRPSPNRNTIWTFKKLVELINAYYEIRTPYKSPYKIAYGWNFSLEKENFKPYLLGCIRNYLTKNGVEFDIKDLQRICALRDDNLQ